MQRSTQNPVVPTKGVTATWGCQMATLSHWVAVQKRFAVTSISNRTGCCLHRRPHQCSDWGGISVIMQRSAQKPSTRQDDALGAWCQHRKSRKNYKICGGFCDPMSLEDRTGSAHHLQRQITERTQDESTTHMELSTVSRVSRMRIAVRHRRNTIPKCCPDARWHSG